MQNSNGKIWIFRRVPTLLKPASQPTKVLTGICDSRTNLLDKQSAYSTSATLLDDRGGGGTGGGFFNSFFGKSNVALQHSPHKQASCEW